MKTISDRIIFCYVRGVCVYVCVCVYGYMYVQVYVHMWVPAHGILKFILGVFFLEYSTLLRQHLLLNWELATSNQSG